MEILFSDRTLLNGTRQPKRRELKIPVQQSTHILEMRLCNLILLSGTLQINRHRDRSYRLKKGRMPWKHSCQIIRCLDSLLSS